VKNCWWWTEELSETCRVLFQNKFEELVHLVGFIIRIYHDARSPECQNLYVCLSMCPVLCDKLLFSAFVELKHTSGSHHPPNLSDWLSISSSSASRKIPSSISVTLNEVEEFDSSVHFHGVRTNSKATFPWCQMKARGRGRCCNSCHFWFTDQWHC